MKHPVCAQCGSEMVVKTGIYGKFWGCMTWPKCDYTKSIRNRSYREDLEYEPQWGDSEDDWLENSWIPNH